MRIQTESGWWFVNLMVVATGAGVGYLAGAFFDAGDYGALIGLSLTALVCAMAPDEASP